VKYNIEESRTGFDRRQVPDTISKERRVKDRRSLINEQGNYIGLIQKIPIFNGITLNQFKQILRICSKKSYPEDTVVIQSGSESERIFILIKGILKVVFTDGKELSRISPVETVGEMGLFTAEKRSASVVTAEESILLSIHKKELMNLFRKESDVGIQILTNVISDMSNKLKKSNTTIEELKKRCLPGEYTKIISKTQEEAEEEA